MPDQLEILIKARLDEAASAAQIQSDLKSIVDSISKGKPIEMPLKINTDKVATEAAAAHGEVEKHLKNKPVKLNMTLGTDKSILSNRITAWMGNNTKATKQFEVQLTSLQAKLAKVTNAKELTAARKEFTSITSQASAQGLLGRNLGDEIKNNLAKFSSWFGIGTVISSAVRGLKDMVSNVKAVDTSMIELRKVTDATNSEFDQFFTNTKKNAVELSATLTDIIDATSNFSRLGYNLQDAEQLGLATTIFTNVGDDIAGIDDASDAIISAMKAYGIEAENVMTIVDKFNSVGNQASLSSGALAEAFTRSASAMELAGNTIDETMGLIVAGNEVVRDPAKVGTSLRSTSLRIRGMKTELEEIGEGQLVKLYHVLFKEGHTTSEKK